MLVRVVMFVTVFMVVVVMRMLVVMFVMMAGTLLMVMLMAVLYVTFFVSVHVVCAFFAMMGMHMDIKCGTSDTIGISTTEVAMHSI